MASRIVIVGSKVGLHARPAAMLVKAAAAADMKVTIGRLGAPAVNAASMLSVLGLGVQHGESVEIVVGEGTNAEAILEAISTAITTDHDDAGHAAG